LSNGLYHLFAKIADAQGHARYAQLSTPLSVSGAANVARVITKEWTGNVDASWSNPSNWTPGGTPAAADRAALVSAAVNVNANIALTSTDIHGGALYVLSGSADTSLFADGNATIMFDATQHLHTLALSDSARLSLPAGGGKLLALEVFSVTGNGTIDLNDNDLLIDYTGASPLAMVENSIRTARNGGTWTGNGITSTTAKNNPAANTTLGAMEAIDYHLGLFDGESPDVTTVLVKYTYYGDADFSGTVNFDDYVRTDVGFNTHLTGWSNGDFNYSGAVDFDDYVLIDVAFNTQTSVLRPRSGRKSLPKL
jgi:hypothetical protein